MAKFWPPLVNPEAVDYDLIPAADSTYDQGTALVRWANGFFDLVNTTSLVVGATGLASDLAMSADSTHSIGTNTVRPLKIWSDEVETTLLVTPQITPSAGLNITGTGAWITIGSITTSHSLSTSGSNLGVAGSVEINGTLFPDGITEFGNVARIWAGLSYGTLVRGDEDTTIASTYVTVIYGTTLTASRTATLPVHSSAPPGLVIHLAIKAVTASGTYTVTLDGNGADTINGAANQVITVDHGYITVQRDTAEWTMLAHKLT